jgi:hypothetical protein
VGNGETGKITVTTSGGSHAIDYIFTYTGTNGTTPQSGLVSVSHATSVIPVLLSTNSSGNNFNLTISNGLAQDIFNGQLKLTIQYIGFNPADYTNQPLTASGVNWNQGVVCANSSLEIVGNTSTYILAGGSKTLTVNFSVPVVLPAGCYIKILNANYTGYMQ